MCKRLQHAVIPIIETLEGRLFLSASVQGTTLTVDGNATAPNKICVSYVRKTHSIRVVENRVRQDFPMAGLTGLQITGGSSRDVITVAAGISLPTTINGMGGNDQITGGAENDTIITGQGSSVVHPGLGHNSIDLTLGSNRVYLTRKAADTIVATKQDKVIGATSSTQIVAPSTPAGAPASPPIPPAPPLPPAPSGPQELIPGTGFSGPTAQPAQVGSGWASDAKSIAHWDVVPFQTFDDTFDVGVIAFHANGIDHVAMSVNGGQWVNIPQPALNPQSNVVEYWAQLNATNFAADGPVEVRAVAYPVAGVPRVLESLFLNADPKGTLNGAVRYVSTTGSDTTGDGSVGNPFATIYVASISAQTAGGINGDDNATIYLESGDYDYAGRTQYGTPLPTTPNSWLTISSAPGVDPSTVRLVSTGHPNALEVTHLRVSDLTVYNTSLFGTAPSANAALWFDGCTLAGTGPADDIAFAGTSDWTGGIYATNTNIHDVQNGLEGATLERNVSINNIGEDSFHNCPLIVNCSVDTVNPVPNAHSDVVQYDWPGADNTIVYGLKATNIAGDAIFTADLSSTPTSTNQAFVNVSIQTLPGVIWNSQWLHSTNHLIFWNVSLTGSQDGALFSNDSRTTVPTVLTDLSIKNCVFQSLSSTDAVLGVGTNVIDSNEFISGQAWGTSAISG